MEHNPDQDQLSGDSEVFDPAEAQSPPEGFEPQVELAKGQSGGIVERPSDLIADAEDQDPDTQSVDDGGADEDDDYVEDGDD